jgi:hypothetical protein
MSFSMYALSVPVFLRGLEIADGYCDAAVAFATTQGMDPFTLVNAQLAPDLPPFGGQIQRISDGSKGPVARLAGISPPRFEDVEQTLPELKVRIARTGLFVRSIKPEQLRDSEGRTIEHRFPSGAAKTLRGGEYLTLVALPEFYYRLATAHDILRYAGVPLGKRDFLFLSKDVRGAVDSE